MLAAPGIIRASDDDALENSIVRLIDNATDLNLYSAITR
jgi:hypothetical protein